MPSPPKTKKKFALPYKLRIRCEHRDLDDGASTSSIPSPPPPATKKTAKTKPKCKTQKWKDKVAQTDPEKSKRLKTQAKLYSAYYRAQCASAEETLKKRNISAKEKEEAEKWLARKNRNNETARIRMEKMNNRRKEENKKGRPKKVLTRQQHEQSKNNEAERKRKQRAGWSDEQKEAVLQRRRELYAIKVNKEKEKAMKEQERLMKEREEKIKEMEQQLQSKEIELSQQNFDLQQRNVELQQKNAELEKDAIDLRSKAARQKALERARKALPKRRSHCLNTSVDLITQASPSKVAYFKKAGMMSSDKLHAGVMDAVSNGLHAPKNSAARKSLATTLNEIKKARLQREFCRRTGVSRKLVQHARKSRGGRKKVPQDTINAIHEFYEQNSNQLPDKKLVSKKTMKPRYVMDVTTAVLYKHYTQANPDKPVCPSLFYKHRPKHVRYKQQAKYIGCLCEYCENVALKIQVIKQIQPSINIKTGYDLVNKTLCAKRADQTFHDACCIRRQCEKCGISLLEDALGQYAENKDTIHWKRWEVKEIEYKKKNTKTTKTVKKRCLELKSGTFRKLLDELKKEIEEHAEHLFNKDWQHNQEKTLKENLKADEVLAVFDFAENYKCSHQREVQSAYYSQDSATLHPVVVYYVCSHCLKPVTESCIMISDDLTHDHHLVHKFQEVVAKHLRETRQLDIATFYRFSDGCSSQYKSKGPISDISYGRQDFGFTIMHNYSGTRRGKGPSDGESGVIKRSASDAVKAEEAIINTPKAFFNYVESKLVKDAQAGNCCTPFRRSVFFIPYQDVEREKPGRVKKRVEGTRKLHSIKTVRGGVVAVRNLSCFCNACLHGGECKNADYVNQWEEITLQKTSKKKKTNTNRKAPQVKKKRVTKKRNPKAGKDYRCKLHLFFAGEFQDNNF